MAEETKGLVASNSTSPTTSNAIAGVAPKAAVAREPAHRYRGDV